jgi:putative ATP-dependent endonuclease of the OLD family
MYIKKITIEGFKMFERFQLELNEHLNVIVGNNETGKTTLLEAINLVLSCQIDGRNVQYELNPHLFNSAIVGSYFEGRRQGEHPAPPRIMIEAYFEGVEGNELARLKGTNNSAGENCPGLQLLVELDEKYSDDFREYTSKGDNPNIIPTEYYKLAWRSFADNPITARSLPFHSTVIDTSLVRGHSGPNKYISKLLSDALQEDQRLSLAMAYRKLKNSFLMEDGISGINDYLDGKKGDVTDKTLTVSMDMSARSSWESSITAHLDDIPFDSVGKGEQCRVQMKLAIEAADKSNVLLIEEPENHLSHSNMSKLLEEIAQRGLDRQIVLTTHSSFVLNKLGAHNVKLLSGGQKLTLMDLSRDTQDYFMRLPGYDTLRLILSAKTILVEGPSDELIVQKAYLLKHGKLPLEDGIDVISVGTAFKRFLEIGALLKLNIRVVTDNDNDVVALRDKYKGYLDGEVANISICYDDDGQYPTLEPQLLKANSLEVMNRVLGKAYTGDQELLKYMGNNKTETALKVFNATEPLKFPDYICDAIR